MVNAKRQCKTLQSSDSDFLAFFAEGGWELSVEIPISWMRDVCYVNCDGSVFRLPSCWDFLQWKKETMKEHELFAIPMQGCREANWPGRRRANTPKNVHRYIEHACMSWCKHVWTCVDRPSGHSSSCRGGRVKAASGLPAKVGTTSLSCGVGGRDRRPLVIARLAMER
ncbi:hypothetical protein CDL15_Pgr026276 [Punica granatum]|uniref:Uncharacterized protein n=1 Tax=Punica granatum TaxID=22663 RepID=A0A218XVW8_PUNGR|nr:hypothetical protein CDL15_Pgr026276 [Punica granatum]